MLLTLSCLPADGHFIRRVLVREGRHRTAHPQGAGVAFGARQPEGQRRPREVGAAAVCRGGRYGQPEVCPPHPPLPRQHAARRGWPRLPPGHRWTHSLLSAVYCPCDGVMGRYWRSVQLPL
eukprot:EG_transcript_27008